jgi:hypothetical protein
MLLERLISIGLFLSFLLCYLEWGGDNSGFLFQLEYQVFIKQTNLLSSITHPLIFLPLSGQLLLLLNTFQKYPKRKLVLIGMLLLAVLVLMILLVGLLAFNYKTIISTLPFLGISMVFIFSKRKTVKVQDTD